MTRSVGTHRQKQRRDIDPVPQRRERVIVARETSIDDARAALMRAKFDPLELQIRRRAEGKFYVVRRTWL